MKTLPATDEEDPSAGLADWKASPQAVLEIVNDQLADHGLEVVMIETHSDEYAWKIFKRAEVPINATYTP